MSMFEVSVELGLFFEGFEAPLIGTLKTPLVVKLLVHFQVLLQLKALVAVSELANKRSDVHLFQA